MKTQIIIGAACLAAFHLSANQIVRQDASLEAWADAQGSARRDIQIDRETVTGNHPTWTMEVRAEASYYGTPEEQEVNDQRFGYPYNPQASAYGYQSADISLDHMHVDGILSGSGTGPKYGGYDDWRVSNLVAVTYKLDSETLVRSSGGVRFDIDGVEIAGQTTLQPGTYMFEVYDEAPSYGLAEGSYESWSFDVSLTSLAPPISSILPVIPSPVPDSGPGAIGIASLAFCIIARRLKNS